ncbi:MAG: ferritin-like domain-containing protein [Thermoplasmata archaeon]
MGEKGKEIVGKHAEEVIKRLNQALATEGLEAYRFLYLSKWAAGLDAPEMSEIFTLLSQHEWQHMETLMERIVQLGGRPLTRPSEFERHSYAHIRAPPEDRKALHKMLEDSLDGERQEIEFYKELADYCRDVDLVTYRLALEALSDEVDDEERLENLLD